MLLKFIVRTGFHSSFEDWHITRHEIFGVRFKLLWVNNASEQINDFALQEGEADVPFLLEY